MKIVIPGGSGQVGTLVARRFHERGDEVCVLSRHPKAAPWQVLLWDAKTLGPWTEAIDGADVVANMAGRSVNCRYNQSNRDAIMNSRVDSTHVLGEAIAAAKSPPKLWLQSSTATIYAHRFDAAHDEATGIIGGREPGIPDTWKFSVDVAEAWEKAAQKTRTPGTRLVLMRSAMVMSPDRDGIFDTLLTLVRRGLGGTAANGKQFISWIHEIDFLRALDWIIEHEDLDGPVNLASPNPLPNREFMRTLRKAWGQPIGLPATRWMLAIGAFFMRTETELILKSRRVTSGKLLHDGFQFEFGEWTAASQDLCDRWRKTAAKG